MKRPLIAKSLAIYIMLDMVPGLSYRDVENNWDDGTALRLCDALNDYFGSEPSATEPAKGSFVTTNIPITPKKGRMRRPSKVCRDLCTCLCHSK